MAVMQIDEGARFVVKPEPKHEPKPWASYAGPSASAPPKPAQTHSLPRAAPLQLHLQWPGALPQAIQHKG